MKRRIFFIFIALVMLSGSCKKDEIPELAITVSGIDFKPNFFQLEGKIVGIDADIAAQAFENAGIPAEFNMSSSWDEAYKTTLKGPNKALLTVAYTKERKDLFKWAGPTCKRGYEIFAKASSGVAGSIGVEASKSIESIAAVRDWEKTTLLEEMGFTNLRYYNTYEEAITAFKNDDVKAIASEQVQFLEVVTFDYYMQQKISVTCIFDDAFFFIAFSKDVDDQVVKRCQDAIDALIIDGSTLDIYRKYVPYAVKEMVPSLIQLATEINPPFNYLSEVIGAQTQTLGSSVEIVTEMQAQNSYKNPICITSWVSAYELVQFMPNYALFTTARTPERENLFQWVGPISKTTARFYTTTASGIKIQTLDQAKAIGTIATPQDWFTHDFLIKNGFQNILATASTPEEAFNQLKSGEADALLLHDTSVKWLCDKTDTPQTDISKQFEVGDYTYYIAFSLNTSTSIVSQWQSNLDAMKADGRFETIWNKWYGDIPMP
ncbi:MAG TPA: transporter substrate-binding domain-containing protein [Prolixibacteraceae bacterium]|nr:transporter substrate-binding domain-containing protein [Prolixibacteraceae bacterium]